MSCCDSITVLNIKAVYEAIPHGTVSKGKVMCTSIKTFGGFSMFSQKYICKHMKCRSLSHWLLCCHPETQLPCWAPHLLMALVTAWVQTFPIFFVINVSSLICFHLKNTDREKDIVCWGQSETKINRGGESWGRWRGGEVEFFLMFY